jgi:hypothetical protein
MKASQLKLIADAANEGDGHNETIHHHLNQRAKGGYYNATFKKSYLSDDDIKTLNKEGFSVHDSHGSWVVKW